MDSYGVEWDRVLITTLGVANKRLYELRCAGGVEGGVEGGVGRPIEEDEGEQALRDVVRVGSSSGPLARLPFRTPSSAPRPHFRFQTANDTYEASRPVSERISASFSVREVDPPSQQAPASLRAI